MKFFGKKSGNNVKPEAASDQAEPSATIISPSVPVGLPREIVEAMARNDQGTAFRLLKPLAEHAGTPFFYSALGQFYSNGWGVEQNHAESVRWYAKGAEGEDAQGQYGLALHYHWGKGVAQNLDEAMKWYRKAADQGYPPALVNLAVMHEEGHGVAPDAQLAIQFYRKAAENGNVTAQSRLGMRYHAGTGVARDDAEAARWLEKAALQNDPAAQFSMGYLSRHGFGIAQNNETAVAWYRKAAENGFPNAMTNLGFMYQGGLGVEQNLDQALEWYEKALSRGDQKAQESIDVLIRVRPLLSYLQVCSLGDISILELASKKDDEAVMSTVEGSPNDLLWSEMEKIGWTVAKPVPEGLATKAPFVPKQFSLTEAGRKVAPRLIHIGMAGERRSKEVEAFRQSKSHQQGGEPDAAERPEL